MYTELIQTIKNTWNPNDKNSIKSLLKWKDQYIQNEPTLLTTFMQSGNSLAGIPWISLGQKDGDYYITILFSAYEYTPFIAIQSKVEDSKTGKSYPAKEIEQKKASAELIIKNQFGIQKNEIDLNWKKLKSNRRARDYERICPLSVNISSMTEAEIISWISKFKIYVDFLNSNNVKELIDDNEFEHFESLLEAGETFAQIKQRIGQARWKKELIKIRGCECALCNINLPELLIASHIKDWAKSDNIEKSSLKNGLILCHNHDKIFDKKLISFDSKGKIIISESLTAFLSDLNIDANQTLKKNYYEGTSLVVEEFMEWHRKEFEK